MKESRKFILRIFFIFIVVLNISTKATAADLRVEKIIKNNKFQTTTLSFSSNSTINTNKTNVLFKTMGLIANGFDVGSIRIKNEGKMDFSYHLKSNLNGEDKALCEVLTLDVIKGKEFVYQGKLTDLSLEMKSKSGSIDDYILILYLNDNNRNLVQKNCQFDFYFKTFNENQIEGSGFSDEKKISNFINSGNW
ncbi:MAG: hypothetical protein PHE32_03020 [Candidatus Shapirobacteria bacterium]|nr:hypothetical protein [Candidatus Shapirobacteria bacterium]MDD4410644.1 hypothetical protein [Candidatus Shapirobacteria bacterium]